MRLAALLAAASLAAACTAEAPGAPAAPATSSSPTAPFDLAEATIAGLQQKMASGQETSHSIVQKYLDRIEALDRRGPALHSVIEVNPDALAIADALDAERKSKGARGPLHGIPILIKDNIATADKMQTTAGSLALVGSRPPSDAFLVTRLRDAGAVILGKTNLSEWANFRSTHSSSGWSGRGGQTKNPYALDRNPSGSSSGSGAAISANLAAVAIGTETDGSIVSPSNNNGLVGIKPTLGLVSRMGIVPIAHSQDTAGPMARSVADAAAVLAAISGPDTADPITADAATKAAHDFTASLDPNGLKGARLGVVRQKLMGYSPAADAAMEAAIADLKRLGATIVDPADLPTLGKFDDSELEVLLFEFKADLNKYLAWLGPSAPVHSLEDIIAFNEARKAEEMPYFGQELMVRAQAKGPLTDPKYLAALENDRRLSRREGIDAVMDKLHLDALVAPTGGPAWLTDLIDGDSSTNGSSTIAAVAGYPHVTVPMGEKFGLPIGLSFIGRAWSEATLIKLAYAFEQGTKHRIVPTFLSTAALDKSEKAAGPTKK